MDVPELIVESQLHWRTWLLENCLASGGVFLVLAKKGKLSATTLTYDQALEEALCFGWIDGKIEGRDNATFRQRFTPRKPRSNWSKRNVGIAERLLAEGRVHPAGERLIREAQDDGRWGKAYAGQATAVAPDDFLEVLHSVQEAREFWETLSAANRYAVLYRIETAKKLETRQRRISQFVDMLARGETFHP